ncbi:hypothetical protein [Xylanibacter ruminicola]|uniref:hypothetical protein n=1 Tax=Xylanibacter ruminicola TaxID=839 RepID=UPI00056473D8|nr:hypothetical protein [Xylanibacter ruminicola]
MWKYIVFILCLYFYFHDPYLGMGGGVHSIRLLYLPAIYIVFKKYKEFSLYLKIFKAELFVLLLTLTYTLLRTAMGGEYGFFMIQIEAILDLFVLPFMFIIFANSIKISNEENFLKSLMIVGGVAAFITILCLTSPTINAFVRMTFLRFDDNSSISLALYRSFGISDSITSHYGYIQGTMVVFACYYSKYNKWILWLTPFYLLSGMVNARTGGVVAIVGVAIYLMSNKNIKSSILFIIVASIVFYNIESLFSMIGVSGETSQWLESFVDQIDTIISQRSLESGTTETLIDTMWIMPQNMKDWIWGIGRSVFSGEAMGQNSDVGYVNQIMYGGLLYVIPLFSYIIVVSRKLAKNKYKSFGLFFFLAFLILNLKCRYLPNGGELRLLILFATFVIYTKYVENKRKQLLSSANQSIDTLMYGNS